MDQKRQFEILLVRLVPHALRDDFMTVGVVVTEPGGEFADVRLTRDWKRVECFAPDLELEIFEHLGAAVRERLKDIRGREGLLRILDEQFGSVFDVGPAKALVADDPAAEMHVLERDYLQEMRPAERARRLGRMGIVARMQDAFAEAGLLEMLQRDLEMKEFTGENDPFRVDFGFRVGTTLKMFHGLALNLSREPAVTLAYRYGRIRDGMKKRGEEALMTAVISEEARRARGELGWGVAMLRDNSIEVRGVAELGEIAAEVRRGIGA